MSEQNENIFFPEEIKNFEKPKFIARQAGKCYSFASGCAQIIGVAIIVVVAFIFGLLNKDTDTVFFDYLQFITQIILAGVVITYMLRHKATLKDMKIKKCNASDFAMAVIFGIGVMFAVNPMEAIFAGLLSLTGYNSDLIPTLDLPTDGGYFVLTLFFVAVLPAIFEELLMRGIVLNGTSEYNTSFRIIMNGLLFSLLHANPSQTCYTFLLGCAFALIAIRCDSIIPTMVIHFLNNAMSVIFMHFNIIELSSVASLIILAVSAIFTIIGLYYFTKINKNGNTKCVVHKSPFVKGCLFGIIFNCVLWFFVFISYNEYFTSAFTGLII